MKKTLLIGIALAFWFIFILGCGSNAGDKALTYNFKQGVSEIVVDFLDNAPPERVYPTTSFKIIALPSALSKSTALSSITFQAIASFLHILLEIMLSSLYYRNKKRYRHTLSHRTSGYTPYFSNK